MIVFVRLATGAGRLVGRAAAGLGRAGLRGLQAVGRQLVQQVGRRAGDSGGLDLGGLPGGGGGGDCVAALPAAARAAAVSTVERAAAMMVAEAQRRAPVDTGRLRDSIVARRLGSMSWEVSADVDYAAYVEYGTSTNPAQPYFRPAYEKVKAQFANMAAKELNAAIDRACR